MGGAGESLYRCLGADDDEHSPGTTKKRPPRSDLLLRFHSFNSSRILRRKTGGGREWFPTAARVWAGELFCRSLEAGDQAFRRRRASINRPPTRAQSKRSRFRDNSLDIVDIERFSGA